MSELRLGLARSVGVVRWRGQIGTSDETVPWVGLWFSFWFCLFCGVRRRRRRRRNRAENKKKRTN